MSKFNFDDALFTATRTASMAPVRSGPLPTLNIHSGHQQPAPAQAPPVYSYRSASANSFMGGAGGAGFDDNETVGSVIARWGAGIRRESDTAPNSTHTTPRGDVRHAAPMSMPPSFSAHYQPTGANPVRPSPYGMTADVEASSLEQLQRKLAQDATKLAQLEAEEAQLAAEERALQLQLRETTAQHRSIDAAMFAMQQEWCEVHAAERSLRLEPVLDLSHEIAHAEGTVEVLRVRHEEVGAKHRVMMAQLDVARQVEEHKTQQRAQLAALERGFKDMAGRRAQLVQFCERQAQLEAARERIVLDASALLDRAERSIAATSGVPVARLNNSAFVNPPAVGADSMPQTVRLPPALKGARAAHRAAVTHLTGEMIDQALAGGSAAPSRAQSIASAKALSQARPITTGGAVAVGSRHSSSSCARQAMRGDEAMMRAAAAGVSFAIEMDEDRDEDDDVTDAAPPLVDPLDITGGMSFVFPTTVMDGTKRHRLESLSALNA
jgi:hypothetical protein